MCGIVATIGRQEASPFLLHGLQALEYRGYDSAGLAVAGKSGIECIKVVGQVSRLADKIKGKRPAGRSGIGHTRWATHGRVLVRNAHPHFDSRRRFFVVHNGIIENFSGLKRFLAGKGYKFHSDTDSEVVAQLLAYHHKQAGDTRQAIFMTLRSLKGAYALAIIDRHEPAKLWAAKLSGPLVLGIGEDQFYLASDPLALAGFGQRMVLLEDHEVAELTPEGYTIFQLDDEATVERPSELLQLADKESKLEGYPDFMSQEIAASAQVLENVTRGRLNPDKGVVKLGGLDSVADQLAHIERILIIACGTSYYAGLIGEYLFEEISHLPVEVQLASEFRYKAEPLSRSTAVLVISQSGETADTIAALQKIETSGILKLGVVNVVGSTLSRMTDAGVYCQAGVEKSVAATKSFVAQVTVLLLMALYFNPRSPLYEELTAGLAGLADRLRSFFKRQQIAKTAKQYSHFESFSIIGRRYTYPIALEAALKLKEVCYIHAEGLAAGEIKHGPLALIDKHHPTLAIALKNDIYDKMANNMAEIKARQGRILAIVDSTRGEAARIADDLIVVPRVAEALQPLVAGVACHLFAYHFARELKRPIDKPRNLAKSVTVE